jgi:hypothetical protein
VFTKKISRTAAAMRDDVIEFSSYDASFEDVSFSCELPFYDVSVFFRLA